MKSFPLFIAVLLLPNLPTEVTTQKPHDEYSNAHYKLKATQITFESRIDLSFRFSVKK